MKINLVLDELEGTINLVLSPSCHPASDSCAVVELVAKLVPTRGQTSSVHIRFVQVDVAVSVKNGDVVAQPSSIELRVLQKPDNSVLLMLGGLWGVEATGIVFTNTDLQELILLDILELVSSSDNLPCASSVVVAAVVGNDSTAVDEVVVLVENEAGPGELARAGLAVLETTSRCGEVPCSTQLSRINTPLVAAIPWCLKLACRGSGSNA